MAIKYKPPKQKEDENELRQAAQRPTERQEADSVFGGEQSDGAFDFNMDEPQDVEDRPSQAQEVPPQLETAMREGGGSLAGLTEERQPQMEGAKPEPDEPQGLFEDLGDIDTRQERERQAFADELEARRAEAMQQAEARAGLGGMGLSGATAELTADIGRQEARAGDIAMADLARRQQQETFDDLRRQASIWAFEEEFGVDLNDDNQYGPPKGTGANRPETPDLTGDGIVDEKDEQIRDQMDAVSKSSRWTEATDTNPLMTSDVNDVPEGYRRRNTVTSPDGKRYGFYVPEDGSGDTYLVEEG